MNRPQLTIKTGQVAGNAAIVVIPQDNPTDIKFLGVSELIDQAQDLANVLTESNHHAPSQVIERMLHLLQAAKLFEQATAVADELEESGETEAALLVDTLVAVLKQEMGRE